MDLDTLLRHYLGDDDTAAALADPARIAGAGERIAIDLAIEREGGRRFALWALLDMLGRAPDPETIFKDAREREAARAFARMMARGVEAAGAAAGDDAG